MTTISLSKTSVRRRVVAFLAALCVVVAQVELFLPDEHDGDAATTQLAVGTPNEQPDRPPTEAPLPQPSHTVHVDHCAHTHLFASSALPDETKPSVSNSGRPDTTMPLLASVTAPPHSRPPIA